MRTINLHRLKLLMEVVERGSYSAAARALYVSQPSISKQIHQLEAEMGMMLLEQVGRKVYLTQAGEELYHYARQIFTLALEAEEALGQLKGLQGARVRVGASTTPGVYLLPRVVGAFRREQPGVRVELLIDNTRHVEEAVLNNRVDFAVLGEEESYRPELVVQPLLEDQLVLIVAPEHPLVKNDMVTPALLSHQSWVFREPGSSTRAIAVERFRALGIEINDVVELESTEAVKQAVMANWGLAIVSLIAVQLEVETHRLVVLSVSSNLQLRRTINLAYHQGKRLAPAARLLIDFLKFEQQQAVKEDSPLS